MNPNNQPPVNYLDQISTATPKKPAFQFNLMTIILLGVGAIIVVCIIAAIGGAVGGGKDKPWAQLSARLAATQEVVNSSTAVIKNGQLKSTNSDLKLALANTIRDIQTPLTEVGVDPAELPDDVTAEESSADMLARLEDARLNAKYDSTYAREMNYQLSHVLTLIQQLYQSNTTEENKVILQTAYDSLQPLQQKVADFSASNE